ncbi:MAG: hypothetical protein JWM80_1341 [Cyanobacteria bacterium RYN_339]|nr:hypothetical protein [Cyanobacteria bacterium RYN_339]
MSESGTNALSVAYVDYDKLVADFQAQAEAANAARWAMGDLAATLFDVIHRSPVLRAQFAKQGLSMRAFGRQVGLAPAQLDALRLTAEAFPARERHPGLTWEHHQVLARLLEDANPATRRKWLREAGKKHWTPHQLRREVRPAMPRPETCAEERVRKLRDQLREAEAALDHRRKGTAHAAGSASRSKRQK